jgi:signal transduction histidine kinase
MVGARTHQWNLWARGEMASQARAGGRRAAGSRIATTVPPRHLQHRTLGAGGGPSSGVVPACGGRERCGVRERQRLQVVEAERSESELLSTMSHELRTPLNSILAQEESEVRSVVVYEVRDEGRTFTIADFHAAAEQIEAVRREEVIGRDVVTAFPKVGHLGQLGW